MRFLQRGTLGHSNFYCLFLHSNTIFVVVVVRFLVQSLFLSNQPVISCSHCKWRQFEAQRGSLFFVVVVVVVVVVVSDIRLFLQRSS